MQRGEETALNMPSDPEGPEPNRDACLRADTKQRRLYLSIRCQCHVLPPCGDLRTLRLKNRRSNSVSLLEDAFFCLRCALVGGATTNSLENWCKTNLGDANLSVAKIGGA